MLQSVLTIAHCNWQIKNLSLFTTVRVIFQLTEEMPCISAVVVALLSKPKPQIKYTLKVIGGSTGAIPGLSEMIDEMIESAVADQVQWPHRIVVPIGNAPPDVLSDLGLKLQGKLTVQVIKATNLKNLEMVGKSDPYVRLYVRVLFKEKTRVIDNNLNPVWNEQFEFDVEDQETQSLILDVRISKPCL
jgi:Ca2+-dependent lipid-binding protein